MDNTQNYGGSTGSPVVQDQILDIDGALALMPLMNRSALDRLRGEGKGPKFATVSNRVRFRRSDVEAWYQSWCDKQFTQTKTTPRVRKTSHVPTPAAHTGKGKVKAKPATNGNDLLA